VVVSDLYASGWNPVSDRRNFVTQLDPAYFRQQAEEAHAAQHAGFAPDVQAEMDKLFWCDTLILQFPLWWFGMPAILKGWVDRVFASGGRIYGGGKWYDHGVLAGKRALCALTIGGPASLYGERGLNGPLETILFPIQHGMLAFVGFDVIEPFIVHAPVRLDAAQRAAELERYASRIRTLASASTLPPPRLADYGLHGTTRPGQDAQPPAHGGPGGRPRTAAAAVSRFL
jgi:NAD(P)H dehydrogenase (quinone)